jgi:phenylpyruvate tautomerase PptA (4-oxalocrotonate tautomerase family)
MPYIAINVTEKLSDAQKEKIKAEFGRLVTIIPTKTEARTLIDFSDARTMYKDGKLISGAFIELRLWRKSEFEPKKQFTEETFQMLSRELGLAPENMYLNVMELEHWGSDGIYKS